MAAAWPSLRVVGRQGRLVAWQGPLRPLLMNYEVRISYRMPLVIELLNPMRMQPEVRVVNPVLRHRRDSAEGRLPHVYWDDPECPMLCLFDTDAGEWSPADLLADTTVPWTIDWLACYEGWRATGEWTGGGRHALPRATQGEAS